MKHIVKSSAFLLLSTALLWNLGCAKKRGICEAHFDSLSHGQGDLCMDLSYESNCTDHMNLGALGNLTTYSNAHFTPDAFCKDKGYVAGPGDQALMSFKNRKR